MKAIVRPSASYWRLFAKSDVLLAVIWLNKNVRGQRFISIREEGALDQAEAKMGTNICSIALSTHWVSFA
jgi:hypothetical protein